MAEHISPQNSLHRWTLLPEHSTKGGRAERVEEEGDYSTEKGEESKGISGDGSGTSGASTSGDDEFSGGERTELRRQRRTAGDGDR